MKALSIRQPWAWLIANGHKDVENRTWPTRFRGEVLIHAGKMFDSTAIPDIHRMREIFRIPIPGRLDTGGIVGVCEIVGCVTESKSRWFDSGKFAFEIKNARPLSFCPCKGALGFFDVPQDIIKKLNL